MEPHFYVGRTPVRVEPWFWISAVIFGALNHSGNFTLVALWVPIMFTGILLHELGHVYAGRVFGLESAVVFTGLGAYTFWPNQRRALPVWGQVMVSFAGPFMGLVLGGLTWYLANRYAAELDAYPIAREAIADVIFVNFGWALFNLLPIVPLDGGNIKLALLGGIFGNGGRRFAHLLSVIFSAALVALALAWRSPYLGVMFALLGFQNYQRWRTDGEFADRIRPRKPEPQRPTRSVPPPAQQSIDDQIVRGYQALEAGKPLEVRMIAESLLLRQLDDDQRNDVVHLSAWGRLLAGEARAAKNALALLPPNRAPDALLEGALKLELGQAGEAVPLLVEALRGRNDDFVAARLGKAVALAGRTDEVESLLASPDATTIGVRPFQIVAADLFGAKAYERAARLGEQLFDRFGDARDAFNVACALGRASRPDDALAWLERAIQAGLPDPRVLDTDGDLASLRALPEFASLREKAGLGG